MKRKLFFKFIKTITAAFCAVFVLVFFGACSFGETESSYSITGYVFDEYGAVEGVALKSELGTVYTNKDGKYTISGIKTSVIIEPSCEGYQFEQASKLISSDKDNANFTASKEYVVSGFVKNNNSLIVGAYVTINSLSGKFITTTDEEGYFEGKNVAGKTTVSCKVDGVEFFSQIATIDNNSVNINLTSSFTVNLEFDTEDVDYSDITLKVGNNNYSITGPTTSFDEIYSGTIVEVLSSKYEFNNPRFTINTLNQVENIKAFKKYSVSGNVKSGNVPLSGAIVLVDGVTFATTDQNGWYEIDNLTSVHNITVQYGSLNFNSQVVNNSRTIADFNGTKAVTFAFNFDLKTNNQIEFGEYYPETSNGTDFIFNAVQLGDLISINSNDYHFDTDLVEIGDKDLYLINADCYYDASLTISDLSEEDLDNIQILLDGRDAQVSDLFGLFGKHIVSASFLNYKFSTAEINVNNKTANLTYKIPYDATITVFSGETILSNSKAVINNNEHFANSDGKIIIPEIVGNVTIKVLCNGYDEKIIEIFENEISAGKIEKSANLTYSIYGNVLTGDSPVANAEVKAVFDGTEKTVITNSLGEYVIAGVYGAAQVVVSKQYFTFEGQNVTLNSKIDFDGTYRIFGRLTTTDKDGNEIPYIGIEVVLLTKDGIFAFVTTDEEGNEGYFEFEGIRGECSFSTKKEGSAEHAGLRPSEYKVAVGGEYNFNNNGYSISGCITSGGLPVSGVYVQAGSLGTFTDDDGNYSFALITGSCEIIPQKEGYDFGSKIVVSEDRNDVNFVATYTAKGTIVSGNLAVSGVSVLYLGKEIAVSNEFGEFEATGLLGNCILTFEKQGFKFDNNLELAAPLTININCLVVANINVVTGDVLVSNFVAFANNKEFSANGTVATIYVPSGETVRFEKHGYNIENIVISTPGDYTTNSTYKISGIVASGDVALANVSIKLNGIVYYSDAFGNFDIEGLVGKNEISFEKAGYNFSLAVVTESLDNLNISASYLVTGKVLLGQNALSSVKVTCGNVSVMTDENGSFSFNNVVGRFTLVCEKQGYTFSEIVDAFGAYEIFVEAYFNVSGKIVSGGLAVSGANVELSIANSSKRLYAVSDENGNYEIVGVNGIASIIVSKDGYDLASKTNISDYVSNLEINLTYSYTVSFEGTGKTNVIVYANNEKFVTTSNSIRLKELSGEVSLRFERANTAFSPSNILIKEPGSIVINTTVSYNIYGTVKAEGGFAISNVTVNVGSSTTKTDINGYFSFNGVAGNIQISNEYLSNYNTPISKDGEYNITVKSGEFAYLLFANADKNIRTSASAQITGTGSVVGDAGITKTTQYVHAIYKRDNNGNILRQNLNYGDAVFGIDPKVSMIAYFAAGENKWYYQQVEDGNVTSKTTANHTVSGLKEVTESGFADIYGNPPNNYLPYSITQQTATMSNISVNSNGNYVFTMTLSTSQPGYAKQVVALSGVTFDSFQSIVVTCEIDKNGWFVSISTAEKYKIKQGVSVSITSNISYNFLTRNNNTKIDNIDVSSDVALQSSLRVSEQSELYKIVTNNVATATTYGRKEEVDE